MALPVTKHAVDDSRVIHHELGHWLMAREMGFSVGQIFIQRMNGQASGHATVYPRASSRLCKAEAVDDYISRRIRVLLAGSIVEIEWYKKTFGAALGKQLDRFYENPVIDHSGIGDKAKAEELLVILAGIRKELKAKHNFLPDQIRILFVEIYRDTKLIVETFLEKLFILADLVESEPWQNYKTLTVENERLTELSDIAAGIVASTS
ncbi:hypothetical protein EWW49_00335 [Pseudomonas syringae]|uniref:hypothetical protein n=1 Tax=Pseudomonas sp. MWU16-30316 TaxID=2878093 RepID=UPI001101DCEB|nr:hypothetical protein [Pseudomonas sp. MWU16-30316]TFZ37798.1 hypothetical protein EWW49_00335 [Pseudomonas syringae]